MLTRKQKVVLLRDSSEGLPFAAAEQIHLWDKIHRGSFDTKKEHMGVLHPISMEGDHFKLRYLVFLWVQTYNASRYRTHNVSSAPAYNSHAAYSGPLRSPSSITVVLADCSATVGTSRGQHGERKN